MPVTLNEYTLNLILSLQLHFMVEFQFRAQITKTDFCFWDVGTPLIATLGRPPESDCGREHCDVTHRVTCHEAENSQRTPPPRSPFLAPPETEGRLDTLQCRFGNPSTRGCLWICEIEILILGDVEIFSRKFS
jgi:hypothetical protein